MKLRYLALMFALGGCAAVPRPSAAPVPASKPTTVHVRPGPAPAGLERVIGQTAKGLTALLGQPVQDQREINARRLQFGGGVCVLDAYLYAPASGKEPVVTHVDARRADGADYDRAACVSALERR
jgi:hypothetical protein